MLRSLCESVLTARGARVLSRCGLSVAVSAALVVGSASSCRAWAPQKERQKQGQEQKRKQPGATEDGAPRSDVIDAAQLLRDVRELSSDEMQGRKVDTEGGARAREYVVREFARRGIEPFGKSYLQPFEFTDRKKTTTYHGVNVVGFIRGRQRAAGGKGAATPERYLVMTAHYDHVGVINGEIYNGADDNASGVAALLAVAAYFRRHPPRHTIVFAALDAEEEGEHGAQAFVKSPPVAREAIALNVNLDMVSHNERGELYASGASHYPFLRPYLEQLAKDAPVRLLLGHDTPVPDRENDWTGQSDHAAFHAAGIPYVYFGVEDHPDYHKPTDDFQTITPVFFVHAAETVLAAVRLFDQNLDALGKQRAPAGL